MFPNDGIIFVPIMNKDTFVCIIIKIRVVSIEAYPPMACVPLIFMHKTFPTWVPSKCLKRKQTVNNLKALRRSTLG